MTKTDTAANLEKLRERLAKNRDGHRGHQAIIHAKRQADAEALMDRAVELLSYDMVRFDNEGRPMLSAELEMRYELTELVRARAEALGIKVRGFHGDDTRLKFILMLPDDAHDASLVTYTCECGRLTPSNQRVCGFCAAIPRRNPT